jgi:glycosyltransferase involved in cell wall biosynthesis
MEVTYTYSFIIPHKNCPDLLMRCVDSIPERSDIQIIIVDDNSDTNKKPSLMRESVEVVLLDASCSKGAGRARNVGLEHAKGKWILFADSDDYYHEGFIDILDKYSNKDVDIVYFNFFYRDGITGEELSNINIQSIISEFDDTRLAFDRIKYLYHVPWNKMILHSYIHRHHFSFEEVPNGNDIFFSKCVGYHTDKIIVEKRPVYVYNKNENSIVTSARTVESEMCRLEHIVKQNYFYDFIGQHGWKKSVIRSILQIIRVLGFSFIVPLINNSMSIYKRRKEWVDIIPSMSYNEPL